MLDQGSGTFMKSETIVQLYVIVQIYIIKNYECNIMNFQAIDIQIKV